MIPKIIHYVWVGKNPKPDIVVGFIRKWHKILPNYQFMEWNDTNIDFSSNAFLSKAYEDKEWAFVSDYVRLNVIKKYGGVYFDTDVNLIKNIDNLLQSRAFVGFEDNDHPFTAVFGAEKNHPLIQTALNYYNSLVFKDKLDYNKLVNTTLISNILIDKYHCHLDGKEQKLADGIHVYPSGILCYPSRQSVAIHVFLGSWLKSNGSLFSKYKEWYRGSIRYWWQASFYNMLMKVLYTGIKHEDYHRR